MAEIIIVGGGVAGLSAGIYAQLAGHHAVVIEKNAVAGGNLTGWDRDGYHIDNCIHWLTGTNSATELYKTWEELGVLGGAEIVRNESLYTYEREGESLSLVRDLGKLERRMLELSPRDGAEIRRFIQAVRTVQYLSGVGGKRKNESYGALRTALFAPSLAPYVRMTAGQLSSRFSHPLISGFLSALLTEDFGSLALLIVFANFCADNADLVRGGSAQAAERMARRFIGLGGELILGKEVIRLNTFGSSARTVTLANGRIYGADHFVITADPALVFGKMTDFPMPRALAKRYRSKDLARFSCFQCAFAAPTDAVPFRSDVIFDLPERRRKTLGQKRLVLREFSHEPSFAPEGETVLQTMLFCDESACRGFIALSKRRDDYRAFKENLATEVKECIVERYPGLEGKITLIDSWTPATYRRFVGTETGSFMGFAFGAGTLPRALPPRVRGLDNVFLATQWLQAPGGLPIAANCGKNAIKALERAAGRKTAVYGRTPRRPARQPV